MRTISVGNQDFAVIRENDYFYIDKTKLIRQWWENGDSVTLVTRPRRFGKTLNLSMLEYFFSVSYAGRADLFRNLEIWGDPVYQKLQGTYPVIALSFASVKDADFGTVRGKICQLLTNLYSQNRFLLEASVLDEQEKQFFNRVNAQMDTMTATMALYQLSLFLERYYGKKVLIFLDEYDTPMQEAYLHGFWEELSVFTRSLFNAAFKTNPALGRALLTGITRVGRESIFSDLNNLEVVTATSEKYADCFGFTEEEVFQALKEYGLEEMKEKVKDWYDGFCFGNRRAVYNPWSIINYLDKRKLQPYWANTSSNSLVGQLLKKGSSELKQDFEQLLTGKPIVRFLDEQVVYQQLEQTESAVWSLLLAGGYLRAESCVIDEDTGNGKYELLLTNKEVQLLMKNLIREWFSECSAQYNAFVQAMLRRDLESMNVYMNRVALTVFSYFDTGNGPSEEAPERFYRGFVLGLSVELGGRYYITSNRESGFGRYDVMFEPRNHEDVGMILEFKVRDAKKEDSLEATVQEALAQIERKQYDRVLLDRGIPECRIYKYGFAFEGKKVLIGQQDKDSK